MTSVLFVALARALVISLLALAAMPLLSGSPASARRMALVVSLGMGLVAPFVSKLAPAAIVPESMVERARAPFAERSENASLPALAVTSEEPHVAPSAAPSLSATAVVVPLWAAVAGVLLVRLVVARVRASRLGRRGVELEPGVSVTSDIDGPVVAGTFVSRILLPPSALEWGTERLAVVLAHERAHVAARDGLVRLLADVSCALYWPVPSIWMVARRLARECELAADERAVHSGLARTTVAEHLVAVAKEAVVPNPAATFGMASDLERRVEVLLEGRSSTWSRRSSFGAVLAFAGALSLVACAGSASEEKLVVSRSAHDVRTSSAEPASPVTANTAIAAIAEEERTRAVGELGAKGGVVLVLDAKSHDLLAATGDVDTARVPGSTVKPLLVAAALDANVVDAKTAIDCGNGYRMYGTRKLSDASPHGSLDLASMLAVSSNVGASRIADLLGRERTVRAFESAGLRAGLPTEIEDDFQLAVVASGEGFRATPRALVTAYGALVDGKIGGRDVFRPETAARVRSLLEDVVYAKEGTGGRAAIPSARVAGKTGTSHNGADLYASFVGFLPAGEPRYVIYVGIDAPRDDAPGGKAAAPVFARVASRLISP